MKLHRAPALALTTVLLASLSCSSDGSSTAGPGTAGSTPSVPPGACHSGIVSSEPLFTPPTDTAPQSASYANQPVAAQAKDCDGMRRFISSPQPGFGLQSYCLYGHLKDSSGKVIAFATVAQDTDLAVGSAPKALLEQTGQVVNLGQGASVGGVVGTVDKTADVSNTSNPFSLRNQTVANGSAPNYVDARVVEGQLGQPGAIIQVTSQIPAIEMAAAGTPVAPMQISLRLRDVAGVGQWGYGPSGFFPQWIHANQRQAITDQHRGSVEAYLEATKDPMTDQGSYYYSSPVVDVQDFTITQNGKVISSGTEGELLIDYVTQSFDAQALAVVNGGVQWTEFSTLLEGGRTMKVGKVTQSTVGTLPYAMLLSANGSRLPNGSLDAQRWDMTGVTLEPDKSATWTSPRSKQTYYTTYTAKLSGADPAAQGELTYTALYEDQEVSIGGRTVYEGLYKVQGTVGGQPATGYAWAEVQPSGNL